MRVLWRIHARVRSYTPDEARLTRLTVSAGNRSRGSLPKGIGGVETELLKDVPLYRPHASCRGPRSSLGRKWPVAWQSGCPAHQPAASYSLTALTGGDRLSLLAVIPLVRGREAQRVPGPDFFRALLDHLGGQRGRSCVWRIPTSQHRRRSTFSVRLLTTPANRAFAGERRWWCSMRVCKVSATVSLSGLSTVFGI
jgi:hypothetical protein